MKVDLLPLCPELQKICLWPFMMEFTERAFSKLVAARRRRHLRSSSQVGRPGVQASSALANAVSLLETAIVQFAYSRDTNIMKALKEDERLDLEEFTLIVKLSRFFRDGSPRSQRIKSLSTEEIALVRV